MRILLTVLFMLMPFMADAQTPYQKLKYGIATTGGVIQRGHMSYMTKLDTTISSEGTNGGGGYKVIVGSLLNWDDNCVGGKIVNGRWDCSGSYEAWREKEKSTSWYQAARGDTSAQFPANYFVKIQVGQDSVTVWDRDTGELWMAFWQVLDNSMSTVMGYNSGNLTDIAFLDGKFYFADDSAGFTQWPVGVVDFLGDRFYGWYAAEGRNGTNNIQGRNTDGAFYYGVVGPAIASIGVNAVAVVRDPFGLTDENGAPKHWWIVAHGTNRNTGLYNPHQDAIYDGTATSADIYNVSFNRRGRGIIATNDSGR
jgi:hypothetical protein